jgi:hypothetical protein
VRLTALLGLTIAALSLPALAEPTFIERLEGGAASCSLVGGTTGLDAFLARRDFGESSKKYKALVEKSFRESKDCVDNGKPKMKPYAKDEIAKNPELKPAITRAYAAWLGYMDWLSTPREFGEESRERATYESAINQLRAEIDTM